MKNLILIAVICETIISCSKTTTPVDLKVLKGTYTGERTLYKDENLTIADGTPTPNSKNEIKFINNKYALIIKTTKDTVYLNNIKTFSKEHIAFNLETKTTKAGTVYESLKKYTHLGVAYSGRYKKGTKENLLLYFKATVNTSSTTVTAYAKFNGNK